MLCSGCSCVFRLIVQIGLTLLFLAFYMYRFVQERKPPYKINDLDLAFLRSGCSGIFHKFLGKICEQDRGQQMEKKYDRQTDFLFPENCTYKPGTAEQRPFLY